MTPSATSTRPGGTSWWQRIAKLVVSLGVLGYLAHQIGPARLWESLRSASPGYLLAVFAVICGDSALRAYNWKQVLAARSTRVPYGPVFIAFAVGGFFGSLVPTSLGPVAVRSMVLSRRQDVSLETAASSAVMLNLAGLWALGVAFLVGASALAAGGSIPHWLGGLSLVAASATLVITGLLFVGGTLAPGDRSNLIFGQLKRFFRALASYRDVRKRLPPVFGLALASQLLAMLVFYLAFRVMGVTLDPLYFVALVPAVTLARLVPASVAGFGAEQAVVVVLFSVAGAGATTSTAASLIVSSLNVVFAAACGLLYAGSQTWALVDLSAERGSEAVENSQPDHVADGHPEDGAS